ncbi:MAG: glycosyltransferase family 9 protein [Acidobacteriota bacterium]
MQNGQSITSTKKEKILVYLFGSLGDTLVAIPALRAVRRNFPDCELSLLQNTQSDNIVTAAQVIPEELIDNYLSYKSYSGSFSKVVDYYKLRRELRKQNFQAVVYLVISERPASSVFRDKLFFRSCGIPRLYGFHAFSKDEIYPFDSNQHPALTDNEAIRKLDRLQIDGINILREKDLQIPLLKFSGSEISEMQKWLTERRRKPKCRLIAIAPGCKTEANIWSLENFIQIGDRLINDENCEIIVVGGKAEQSDGEKLISCWSEGINAAGVLSVRQSGTLLSLCDFLIGLDTGTTHLAAAVGTRCLAIYGERNNPGHWYPLGSGHTIIYHPVKCAGCRLFACPLPNHPCMKQITVDSVWQNWKQISLREKIEKRTSLVKTIEV